jgi:hypothetical protein
MPCTVALVFVPAASVIVADVPCAVACGVSRLPSEVAGTFVHVVSVIAADDP